MSDFESTWRDVISGKTRGLRADTTRGVLSLLSGVYAGGIGAYRLGYDWHFLKQARLPCPAVSIGNLTVGGTGKTTTVRWLCRRLPGWGYRPAILSYGYRAEKTGTANGIGVTIVAGPEGLRVPVEQSGDEAQMLARSLPGVPVLIGKNRVASGRLACASFPVDVCLLDDAFQYWPLRRDLDVVLISATNPFGYSRVLPRGMLREPLRALRRAHAVIITHANRVSVAERAAIRAELARWNPNLVVAEAEHAPGVLRDHRNGDSVPVEALRTGQWAALSGLGQPESFEATVASLAGREPVAERFPDHHRYAVADLRRVVAAVQSRRLAGVVTTEKDSVKIPAEWLEDIPCLVVEVDLRFLSGESELEACVRKRIGES